MKRLSIITSIIGLIMIIVSMILGMLYHLNILELTATNRLNLAITFSIGVVVAVLSAGYRISKE